MRDLPDHSDVIVVGGGLVGSALAVALSELNLTTVLVESLDARSLEQPSFDARVTALANSSRRILDGLGLWQSLLPDLEAITDIHISEQGQFGVARILSAQEGVDALGFTIENRLIGRVLWETLDAKANVHIAAPAEFTAMKQVPGGVDVSIRQDQVVQKVRARLVVAADGARSGIRQMLGLGDTSDDYSQAAIIFNCQLEQALCGRAYERFTPDGPLAVLPLSQRRAGIVWTVPSHSVDDNLSLHDEDVRTMLAEVFGGRLGRIGRIGRRSSYPLHRVRADQIIDARLVLIGSAAVNLHPVAGQGFNLALRDVAMLSEVIADVIDADGEAADIGKFEWLERYAQWRGQDHRAIAGITHGLVRVFGLRLPALAPLRGLGLALFDSLPAAKSLFAQRTMGRAGKMPRLAAGRRLIE